MQRVQQANLILEVFRGYLEIRAIFRAERKASNDVILARLRRAAVDYATRALKRFRIYPG